MWVQAWGFGFKLNFEKIYPLESLMLTLEQQLQHGFHRGLEGPAVDLCASNPKITWLMIKTIMILVKTRLSTLLDLSKLIFTVPPPP